MKCVLIIKPSSEEPQTSAYELMDFFHDFSF